MSILPLLPLLNEIHPFMNISTPLTKIILSLSKVNLIFLCHIPMPCTPFCNSRDSSSSLGRYNLYFDAKICVSFSGKVYFYYRFTFIRTKNNSYQWTISIIHQFTFVVMYIHLHLP